MACLARTCLVVSILGPDLFLPGLSGTCGLPVARNLAYRRWTCLVDTPRPAATAEGLVPAVHCLATYVSCLSVSLFAMDLADR